MYKKWIYLYCLWCIFVLFRNTCLLSSEIYSSIPTVKMSRSLKSKNETLQFSQRFINTDRKIEKNKILIRQSINDSVIIQISQVLEDRSSQTPAILASTELEEADLQFYYGSGSDNTYTYDIATHILNVKCSIVNWGYSAAESFKIGFYLSEDLYFSSYEDFLIFSHNFLGTLDYQYYFNINITIDFDEIKSLVSGDYYLYIYIDYENNVYESSESNNLLLGTINPLPFYPPLPELAFYYGMGALNGYRYNDVTKDINIISSIGNYGNAPVEHQFRVGWYLSEDNILQKASDILFTWGFLDSLEPGYYTSLEFHSNLSNLENLTPGYYYLIGFIDDLYYVEEADDNHFPNIDYFVQPIYYDGLPVEPEINIAKTKIYIESPIENMNKNSQIEKAKPEIEATFQQKLAYPYQENELLIQFHPEWSTKNDEEFLQNLGLQVKLKYKIVFRTYLVTWDDGVPIDQKAEILINHPAFKNVEPNSLVKLHSTLPNDPGFSGVFGLNNTGQTGGTSNADINAPETWDLTTGSHDVIVGIIDSGVDYTHPDLQDNIWINEDEIPNNGIDDDANGYIDDIIGWDFADNDNDPMDENGHGTHVAGTIGAIGNNNIGVTGVCWSVNLMPLRIFDAEGNCQMSSIISAIEYAEANGSHLLNNSYGGQLYSDIQYNAIQNIDHLYVAAAGNEAINIDEHQVAPAGYDLQNILSVAAIDCNNSICTFSNLGAENVDVGAYGGDILSTMIPYNKCNAGYPGYNLDAELYGIISGTSMASPQVAGAAALILSLYPDLHWTDLKDALMQNVDVVDDLVGRCQSHGKINVFKAITQLNHPDGKGQLIIQNQGARILTIQSIISNQNWILLNDDLTMPFDIVPLSSQIIEVNIDWNQVGQGNNEGTLCIQSNDTDESSCTVIVHANNTTGIEDSHHVILPVMLQLYPNYPNPFNAQTVIPFDLPETGIINLTVFNTMGQKEKCLLKDKRSAGYHEVIWDASDMESGVYLIKLQLGTNCKTRKILLIK